MSASCLSLWRGHTVSLPFDRLAASDDEVFIDLCQSLRLVCPRCGGRKMHVVPHWPDLRQVHGAGPGVDTRPALPSTALRLAGPQGA